MPRFIGKRSRGLWLDVAAVVVLAVIVVIVLGLTGAIPLFGSAFRIVPV